jgi:adenylosuccinate synthase
MSKVFMVAGLGFGDEGKGSVVDYLTVREKAHTVVRYNGGPQAAHNVVLSDGTHHTFSQFGSGSLRGSKTHLSRFMLVEPVALLREGQALEELGMNVFNNLTIERDAVLVTPYHRGANRLREVLRGVDRHGSCGLGIGETTSDHLLHGSQVPLAKDLLDRTTLVEKLSFIKHLKLDEFQATGVDTSDLAARDAFRWLTIPERDVADTWIAVAEAKKLAIVSSDYLPSLVKEPDKTVIFEGAQGMLLDQNWGFHPYTTWTDITFNNVYDLLSGVDAIDSLDETHKIGVIRSYLTRHGAGPFPTEDIDLSIKENHNGTGEWQGYFRRGHFDMVLFKYALDAIRGVDEVALTHVDSVRPHSMCVAYDLSKSPEGLRKFMSVPHQISHNTVASIQHQEELAMVLGDPSMTPLYWPMTEHFIDVLQNLARVKVGIVSKGPTAEDKLSR